MRNPVKLPSVGHPLKNLRAKIFERDAGAGHKILDRARDDDVVGTSETCDPRGDVHSDAPYVVVRKFDFASVNACANRYSERAQRRDNGLCALNGARGSVERCKKAVPQRLDLPPTKAGQLSSYDLVVLVQQVAPTAVAQCRGLLGRADDIGKENRGQHPIDHDWRSRAGQKLVYRIGDLAGAISNKRYVVASRKLEVARIGDERCEFSPPFDIDGHVILAVDDKRRDMNGGEDGRYVNLAVQPHNLDAGRGICAKALELAPPFLKGLVPDHGGANIG